jgi:hypothetical protein
MKFKIQKLNYFGKDNPNFKGGKPKCKDCNKKLTNYKGKYCAFCYRKRNKKTIHNCKDCKKEVSDYRIKRCRDCASRYLSEKYRGKKAIRYMKYHTKISKIKMSKTRIQRKIGTGKNNPMFGKNRKNEIIKHHIDLNKKNKKKTNILKLTVSKHTSLHVRAYHYLVEVGKIRRYIKWYDKKFGLI